MNKRDYLNDLMELCTDKQRDLLSRMYPDGVKKNQLDQAINQIKRTLKKANQFMEDTKQTEKETQINLDALTKEHNDEIKNLNYQIEELEQELKYAEQFINDVRNPIDIKNAHVQKRLRLLDALEAGGVDNWEWYEESIKHLED